MSAELEKLLNSVYDKSDNTKRSYKVQYNKFLKTLNDLDMPPAIHLNSQQKLLDIALEQPKANSQQALINIAILARRLYGLDVKILVAGRENGKGKIDVENKVKNVYLKDTLPTLEELEEYTQYLYDNHKWTDYIINYLLLNLQVRNQDLNFKIVMRLKDTTNTDKNYIWLTHKKCVFIRNVYKTEGTYGQKVNTILDVDFRHALKMVAQHQKHNEDAGVFTSGQEQIGYYIKKSTYKNIGEGAYMKIIIDSTRGDLQKLKQISENRGTSIKTLIENYDLANQ